MFEDCNIASSRALLASSYGFDSFRGRPFFAMVIILWYCLHAAEPRSPEYCIKRRRTIYDDEFNDLSDVSYRDCEFD